MTDTPKDILVKAGEWNRDMTAAPRGREITVTRTIKGEPRQVTEYVRSDVILASKCGKVIKSYWIPDENRWAGFQSGEEVRAWMAWPTHPDHEPRHCHACEVAARESEAA